MARRSRWSSSWLRLFFTVLVMGVAVVPAALAQQDPFAAVKAAIEANQLPAARQALTQYLAQNPKSLEGRFLLGEVETRSGNYDAAIYIYRQLLAERPDLSRVRLDLGRALFLAGHDAEARQLFRESLREGVPDTVEANIRQYLSTIDARKQYYLNLSIAGLYDTDPNQAPALNVVTVGGLPFQLSKSAQAKPEPGVALNGVGEYWVPIAEQARWRFDGAFYRNEYPGGSFDDMQVRVQTGPQYSTPTWQVAGLGVFAQRWYANDPYDIAYGPRLEAAYRPGESWLFENALEYLTATYHQQTFLNGFYLTDTLTTTYRFDPVTFGQFIFGGGRNFTVNPGFANDGVRFALGFHREFQRGITLDLQFEYDHVWYDANNPIFGLTRKDNIFITRASLYDAELEIFGAIPFLSYSYTNDMANIQFYTYQRHQVQVGLTFQF